MSETASCAFCGAEQPTAAMDMTGNGWRCAQCALRSEIATAQGKSRGMGEHLTRPELEGVVAQGGNEAVIGAMMAFGGVAGTLLTAISGSQIVIVFTGLMFGGFAMVGHGLHRRKQARLALQDQPDARVIQR